jgi:predicted transcriptional regulator
MKTLKEKRETLEIKQQTLAFAAKIRQSDLSKIERGFMKIKSDEKKRICAILNCKESEIIWDVEPILELPAKLKNGTK